MRRQRLQLGRRPDRRHLPEVLYAARRHAGRCARRTRRDPASPLHAYGAVAGDRMITVLLIVLVVIALGFVLNRDKTTLRP
jgi:hypothetical protein